MEKRKSNIELLRIIGMILIIAYHCSLNFINSETKTVFDGLVLETIGIWGILGVDLFFIISFYFLQNSNFKIVKIKKILGQIFFYTIPILILQIINITSNTSLNAWEAFKFILTSLIKCQFGQNIYWFVIIYLLIYLSFPVLNKFLKLLNEIEIKRIVIFLTLLIFFYQMYESVIENYFFAMYIYILVYYIRNYKENFIKKNCLQGFLILTAITILLKLVFDYYDDCDTIIKIFTQGFNRHCLLFLFNGLCIFYIFEGIKMKKNGLINLIASTSFGIYLFHENQIYPIRVYLHKFLCEYSINENTLELWILEIVLLFVTGSIIEIFRKLLFREDISVTTNNNSKKISSNQNND